MHNNFHFFQHLAPELRNILLGLKLLECFSQEKDELIFGFAMAKGKKNLYKQYYLRVSVLPQFPIIFPCKEFSRARKNSVDVWGELLELEVLDVFVYQNERAIGILFQNGYTICLKMFGIRSNILLFHGDHCKAIFNSNLKNDLEIKETDLHRKLLNSNYPLVTWGPLLNAYYKEFGLEFLFMQLKKKQIYHVLWENTLHLSLVPVGKVLRHFEKSVEALQEFYLEKRKVVSIERIKDSLLKGNTKSQKQLEKQIARYQDRLGELEAQMSHAEKGHLIMANIHVIKPGLSEVELDNFSGNGKVNIKLKKDLSPQKNAEAYYRKAKNEQLEKDSLNKNIEFKKQQLQKLILSEAAILQSESLKELKNLLPAKKDVSESNIAFKEFEFLGFQIYVGKNAKNNDELTLRFAKKNDLWLHAKDVSGSHVVVKEIPGRGFPNALIEYAASLAAYHSKRKTDSLVPVIYTLKKYVRKQKGTAPGQVTLLQEKVVLVEPISL